MKISLGILTSNSYENVTEWLAHNNMQHLFNFIHIESSFFGKKRILKKIIKSHHMHKPHTFYIGDETRDIDAAKLSGINAIAVTWGFNSAKILAHYQPQYLAHQPEDILKIFK
jgi:phosphoglycolate phosphatase-like HAD superfamily hydrolase